MTANKLLQRTPARCAGSLASLGAAERRRWQTLMKILASALVLIGSTTAIAGGAPVDTRLAHVVEGAVKAAPGVSGININSSGTFHLTINKVNGKSVCDPAVALEVKDLQDALNNQPNIKENYGPSYYSLTQADGTRKTVSLAQAIKMGFTKGCSDIYVSVAPK